MNADLGVLVSGVQAMLDKIPQGLELARPARVYQTHLKLALMHLRRAGEASTVNPLTVDRPVEGEQP